MVLSTKGSRITHDELMIGLVGIIPIAWLSMRSANPCLSTLGTVLKMQITLSRLVHENVTIQGVDTKLLTKDWRGSRRTLGQVRGSHTAVPCPCEPMTINGSHSGARADTRPHNRHSRRTVGSGLRSSTLTASRRTNMYRRANACFWANRHGRAQIWW